MATVAVGGTFRQSTHVCKSIAAEVVDCEVACAEGCPLGMVIWPGGANLLLRGVHGREAVWLVVRR